MVTIHGMIYIARSWGGDISISLPQLYPDLAWTCVRSQQLGEKYLSACIQ